MYPLITVVICTYNRADVLQGCLQSLVEQTFDSFLYEVVIVNNNSTDQTQEIIDKFCQNQANFLTVLETNQGLSNARNRGWQEARGEFVAYIDDDALADPDWLSEMKSFVQRHPEISVFGGPYDAFSLVAVPDWFPSDYGRYSLGDEERQIKIGAEWLNGTNMIFKRDILQKFGGFNKDLGMNAKKVSYGEETQLLLLLHKNNIDIFYSPKIKVRHLVAAYKMNLWWLLKSNYLNGRCSRATLSTRRRLYSHLYGLLKSLIQAIFTFISPINCPLKQRVYRALHHFFWEVGAFVEYCEALAT